MSSSILKTKTQKYFKIKREKFQKLFHLLGNILLRWTQEPSLLKSKKLQSNFTKSQIKRNIKKKLKIIQRLKNWFKSFWKRRWAKMMFFNVIYALMNLMRTLFLCRLVIIYFTLSVLNSTLIWRSKIIDFHCTVQRLNAKKK
jgi:hypothetical protein